ncbi:hypothetical protein VTP01DRAFT_9744 [Rhizomucor pusillus]|uniref:uncharacterized protein n=1 Tax=Rhizomucor pusillus TaxID=4840 RepID=UPI0037420AAD
MMQDTTDQRGVASKPDRNASIDNVSSSISDVEKSTLHSGTPPNDDIEKLIIDPLNPRNWSNSKRWTNFGLVFFNSLIGYFTSSVYMPATENLREYFDTSLTTINATIALFIFVVGAAPLVWAPLSERVGRRWVYTIAMALYTVFTIICGVATNLGLFFAMRILQGIASSAGMAVGGGTVADLFAPHERGKAMSLFMLSVIIGPAFAPIVGGYVAQYLGWRWIFYISAMFGGAIFIADLLLLRETLYRPQQEQQAQQKPDNGARRSFKSQLQELKFNPLKSLALLLRPDVFLICMPISFAFGWFFLLVTILPSTYAGNYDFETGSLGLLYLTGGIGNSSGSLVAGIVADRLYARQMKSNNGVFKQESRLTPLYLGVPFLIGGFLIYGWFLESHLHWFTPLVGYLFTTFGSMYTITTGTTYLVESYLQLSASVVSVSNFTRGVLSMISSLLAVQIRGSLGDGWTYTVAALTLLVMYSACIPCVQVYGERMRAAKPWWQKRSQQ